MSAQLQARAKAFLARPIPQGMPYVADSLSERFIAAYAENGTAGLEPEEAEPLALCVFEAADAAASKLGEEAAFFRETAEILEAIQAEAQA